MIRAHVLRAFALSMCSIALTAAATEAQTEVCVSKQIGAAGKACTGVLKCYGSAAKDAAAVDSACLSAVQAKLTAKMGKLDELTCVVTSVDDEVWNMLDDFAVATADDELGYESGGACASKKLKAAGKECKALFKCSSSAARDGGVADAACLSDAGDALTAAFAKIEEKLSCTPTGNAGDVHTLTSAVHDEVVDLLRNGHATTTLPPATTTTSLLETTTTLPENQAPTIASVTLTPAMPTETTTLTCTPNGASDPESDPITIAYAWIVNGSPTGDTAETLTGSRFSKGDVVSCTATPDDGTTSGSAVGSNQLTIENTAPALLSAPSVSPSSPDTESVLSCIVSGSEDADGDLVTFSYEWLVNGSPSAVSTSSSFPSSATSHFDSIQCTATPNDGTANGSPGTSSAVVVRNTGPTGVSIDLLPNFPISSQSLSVQITTPSSDVDGDAITYNYYWLVNGAPVMPYPSSSSTLDRTNYSKGATVTVTAVPSDGYAEGSSDDDGVLIRNSPPSVSSASISPSSPSRASTLSCDAGGYSDYDGDPAMNKYQWYRNGSPVPSGSGGQNQTIAGTTFVRGQTVFCVLTADDGDPIQDGNNATSATLTIGNAPPTISTISVSPAMPTTSSTLSCDTSYADLDADPSAGNAYQWYRNSSPVAAGQGGTSATISGALLTVGSTWYCVATPNDGFTNGSAAQSGTVTIQ